MDSWIKGLPYQGNKAQKAKQIISLLPSSEKLIDLMGGGASITLFASQSYKWKSVQYNEGNPDIYHMFDELYIKHKDVDLKALSIPNRERFFATRNKANRSLEDNIIITCWSFSNNRKDFIYGMDKQDFFESLNKAIMFGNSNTKWDALYHPELKTISEKYQAFKTETRNNFELKKIIGKTNQIRSLEHLKRLETIPKNIDLSKIATSNLDYRNVQINEDDIVYIDPPYVNTNSHYENIDFKEDEFVDWYSNICPAREIYISEYTVLPNTEVYEDLGSKHSFTATGKRRNELLLKVKK